MNMNVNLNLSSNGSNQPPHQNTNIYGNNNANGYNPLAFSYVNSSKNGDFKFISSTERRSYDH